MAKRNTTATEPPKGGAPTAARQTAVKLLRETLPLLDAAYRTHAVTVRVREYLEPVKEGK